MDITRVIGIAFVAIGVVLLFFAYQASQAPLEKLTDSMTGRYSDGTMWYIGLGIASVVGGALIAFFGNRIRTS